MHRMSVFVVERNRASADVQGSSVDPVPVVGIASGEEFPDGLTGGAHITRAGGALLLVTQAAVSGPVSGYLGANHIVIGGAFVYGGTVRVSDATVSNVRIAIS